MGNSSEALLTLAVAAAGPISLDRLVALGLSRPGELWRWLEGARSSGLVVGDPKDGPGVLACGDGGWRAGVLSTATPDQWRAILGPEGLADAARAAAQADLRERRWRPAAAILRALLEHVGRGRFPGGDRAWLDALVESLRVVALHEGIAPVVLDEAIAVAIGAGDLRSQAVIAATRGFAAARHGADAAARAAYDRALEASEILGERAVIFEVHVRVAYGQVAQGRPHDAIATFERLLGDLPEVHVPLPSDLVPPFAALPEAPLGVLASSYGQVGQYGRAFDMLHRMREAGARLGRPELTAVGDAFLAGLYGGRREIDRLRAHAEPALAFWREAGPDTWMLWHVAQQLAYARAAEGRFAEARTTLELGQRARAASGMPYFGGSVLFETLERLELEGAAAPEGLVLDAELERMLAWPGPYMSAIAMRYRARRLERTAGAAAADEIDALLARSVAQLRESRASPVELARSLEEQAARTARRGARGEADRLVAAARDLLVSLDLAPRTSMDVAHTTAALAELGRIAALGAPREGIWGEVAARLCAALGAERCALVEASGGEVRPLAARGGGPAWVPAVVGLARERAIASVTKLAPPSAGDEVVAPSGQLLVVPFASPALGRHGWAFLENRHSRPAVSTEDQGVLAFVEAQLGVVLENVALWQELAAARARLERENRYHREAVPSQGRGGRIVGDSPALRRVLALVERAAPATTTVLVTGETGVGKELVAREVHRLSPRSDRPFIAVHIASLAPGLVASALFGHERGAFTGANEQVRGRFELADGGSLFLDEIGELGAEDQVRLLRVLQEGTFERVGGSRPLRSDFRLVAATHRDLATEVRAGRFREDLYFRLAAFPVHVPPLRERREEIPTLALYFMEAFQRRRGLRFEGITEADVERLGAYRWPGNVRELEHVIERAVLLSDPPRLRVPPLDPAPRAGEPAEELATLEEAERRHFRRVIAHARGRISGRGGVAEILGLSPSTATFKIRKLGLDGELALARRA
jgi:transcriptional regulator with GAF, ATPase, and Fis domain